MVTDAVKSTNRIPEMSAKPSLDLSHARQWLGALVVATLLDLALAAKGESFPAQFELSSLDGINGFVLRGIDFVDESGESVGGAGDVNGDGIEDVVIGAPNAQEGYVVFGAAGGFPARMDLGALDGTDGFVLKGVAAYDYTGFAVSGAGDVNGDGLNDILIGAPDADPDGRRDAGEGYVVFGAAGSFPAAMDLGALDGTDGFVLKGVAAYDHTGVSVSGAGDVNGDGLADILIGAYRASSDGRDFAGESYLVFGRAGGFPAAIELGGLDGRNGFVLKGIDANDWSGSSVSGAGDVNGDGFEDIVIGAELADSGGKSTEGESYVVFGGARPFPAAIDLGALNGSNGFALQGVSLYDFSGSSVSGAGDVNSDGLDDILVGAPGAGSDLNDQPGESYVVFGRASDSGPLSVGGSVAGMRLGTVICANRTSEQRLQYPAGGATSWDCTAEGLVVQSGDPIWIGVQGVAMASTSVRRQGKPFVRVKGELTDATLNAVKCHNLTTGKSVFDRSVSGSHSWDCEKAGLEVKLGNLIRVATQARVD